MKILNTCLIFPIIDEWQYVPSPSLDPVTLPFCRSLVILTSERILTPDSLKKSPSVTKSKKLTFATILRLSPLPTPSYCYQWLLYSFHSLKPTHLLLYFTICQRFQNSGLHAFNCHHCSLLLHEAYSSLQALWPTTATSIPILTGWRHWSRSQPISLTLKYPIPGHYTINWIRQTYT